MPQAEAASLRQYLRNGLQNPGRVLRGAEESIFLGELDGGTSLGGRLHELAGRSVLLVARDQLAAALALIEIDGVARRIVLCPPDLAAEYIGVIARNAEIDAVVADSRGSQPPALDVGLRVDAGTRLGPGEVPPSRHRTEWVLLTSGTTGAPKLVRHDIASLTAPIKPVAEPPIWGTFYDIRRYGGLQIFLRALVGAGSMILSSDGEAVADHVRRLAAGRVTHLSGTPSHWRAVLMSGAASLIAVRQVRLSGEIADQTILDNLRAAYPNAQVGHAFASTEAGLGFEVTDSLEGFPAALAGADGDVEIKIESGSLRLRSPRTAYGYLGSDVPALLDGDGFVDTGDIVELRGERYYFVGRREGIINVGGRKVHPEEVEAAINRHPDVRASLVRSRKNPITGAIVVADVVLKDEPSRHESDRRFAELEREIVAICRHRLAPYKVPAAIRFVAGLDLSATGKLVRQARP
jgi:acyl-coenzyme A synthetase/AMP-(fatty) acid ligase